MADAVLGLDTATALTAVAVTRSGEAVFERAVEPGDGGRPRHATALLPAVEEAVAATGGWKRIERLAVGIGPGSFTGLRIGVATARALAQALAKPLVPVSSLAALAAGIGELEGAAGRHRLALIDARRNEAFAELHDGEGERLWEPFLAEPATLAEWLRDLAPGPLTAGDGALRFRHELEAAGAEIPPGDGPVHRLSARHVCRLAETNAPARLEAVEPVYLRRPDAELWRERVRDDSGKQA